eukprot:jgi/Hompol1/2061/HPOL_005434-RA
MIQDSTVELQRFLVSEKYNSLMAAMDQASFDRILGPPNVQRIHVLGDTQVPAADHLHVLDDFKGLLSSDLFAVYLGRICGMQLNTKPASSILRVFQPGDYTLMHDQGIEPVGLDVVFSCAAPDSEWDEDLWGGGMHYIADKDTLLSLYPKPNTLFL